MCVKAYRQRLGEEEASLYTCVIGQFEHDFQAVWVILWWLGGKTLRLALFFFVKCLNTDRDAHRLSLRLAQNQIHLS